VTDRLHSDHRRAELASNLEAVRARIDAACAEAGRAPSDVTLIAVTKTFPASDVELLAELGIGHVAENRDQEAAAKVAELALRWGEPSDHPVRWHFVGALQTNKCASVARYASMVHSVDRLHLVEALRSAVRRRATMHGGLEGPSGHSSHASRGSLGGLDCLVQVDLGDEAKPGRSGARPGEVPKIADAVEASPGLRLAGVMTVAPLGGDPHQAFATLADISAALQQRHPGARVISAGMSGDLEAAVAAGATHLRVGAALLGSRGHAG